MPNTTPPDDSNDSRISRRRLLQGSGGVFGLLGLGPVRAGADSSHDGTDGNGCPKLTLESNMIHYDDSIREVCSDDHPVSREIQTDAKTALEERYPTVGSLIDAGFIPYFDFFTRGSWSHWINPEFIGDDSMLDPERPESILVDHTWWRPIGVMFIATDDGEAVNPPPIYTNENRTEDACTPWHAHTGFPGRYSWWKYQKAYQRSARSAGFPCRTPWMMHVWIHSHPESIYAHAAPDDRGGPPAEPPGFETDADPGTETLGPHHLPDAIRRKADDLW